MGDRDERGDWHEQPDVMWAAGMAAAALLVVLVVAVIRTSNASHAPAFVPTDQGGGTTSTSVATPTSTSSSSTYVVPSVQTSQGSVPSETGEAPPPAEPPPTDESTTQTSTTVTNPYGTTTPTNAGHV